MPSALSHTLASALLGLALAQSLLLAAALLLLRRDGGQRRPGQRLLAALVLVLALFMAHAWLDLAGVLRESPRLQRLLGPWPLLLGPLLWLSLRQLLQQGPPLDRRCAWHGLPFALASLAWLPMWISPPQLQAGSSDQVLPRALLLFGLVKAVHLAIYLGLSLRLLRRARAQLDSDPAPDPAATQGLQVGLVRSLSSLSVWLAGGLALAALLFVAENLAWDLPLSSDLCAALAFTAFVHGLAFMAMRLPLGYQPPLPPQAANEPPRPKTPPRLSPDEREQSLARLQASMVQEERFRDGELSLEQLAAHLALTPAELSQLINQSCGLNFQEYLNRHRVEALQRSMRDPAKQSQSILELALAAGFNSKSSLNRVFKKHTGLTPSQYREGIDPP